jgi:hypothetical protein
MQTELRKFIEQSLYHRATLNRVAELLPADDGELDGLIAGTVTAAHQKEFIFVTLAALGAERKVSVQHLARGAMLISGWHYLAWIAWHMEGELPEPLLAALQQTVLAHDMEATALFVIAAWCREHRGGVLPDGVMATARSMVRQKISKNPNEVHKVATLRALAALTGDAALLALLREHHGPSNDAGVKTFIEGTLLRYCRCSFEEMAAEKPANTLAAGTTLRRAVPRIGRNEPCPCGSGKKYKHCCIEKDQERLHHSSDVAGFTREQVEADPEQHLTLARLEKTMPGDVLQYDPKKIPPDLLQHYFARLAGFSLFDRMAEAFEMVGFSKDLKDVWKFDLFFVTRAGRADIARRMLKWHPDAAAIEKDLKPGTRLLLAQDEPARYLELLDDLARQALLTEDSQKLEEFAFGILESKHRALGIFVARSMVPLIQRKDAVFLFNQILEARDKLNLSPDDPFSDIMDQRLADQEAGDDKKTVELRKTQRLLEIKAQEVRELKDSLGRMQKEITRREWQHEKTEHSAPTPADDAALAEMRNRMEELKARLKNRHNERNELRRELQKAHAVLDEMRQKSGPLMHEENHGPDVEDSLLLPQTEPEVQPVRLMEFPKHFLQALAPFPRHVARAAMIMIGRLAAGEPAAFVGALRLKATPNVMRQRIGSDYRLLFRLWPERLEVIDLINRKDLERRIKTLA